MGRNLIIPYYHPTFVKKTRSEVGHGTFYPLSVTLDQIAEIFFRVKDAWISSGSVTWTESSPSDGNNDFTMTVPSKAPRRREVLTTAGAYQTRGFTRSPPWKFGLPPYDKGRGTMVSDIADDELGIWDTVAGIHKCAFTFFAHNLSDTSSDFYPSLDIGVIFTGEIGVIKANPSDDMMSPNNDFYIGMYFIYNRGYGDASGSTSFDVYGANFLCNYIMRLANKVDLSCPIYYGANDYSSFSGTDFIHEATEWWPYADDSGNPVWDTSTGKKL